MEKKINRKLLEDVLTTSRAYWQNDICTEDEIREGNDRCQAAADALQDDCGIDSWTVRNFVDAIVRYNGLKRDATNAEIIELLKLLGWTVTDDE